VFFLLTEQSVVESCCNSKLFISFTVRAHFKCCTFWKSALWSRTFSVVQRQCWGPEGILMPC